MASTSSSSQSSSSSHRHESIDPKLLRLLVTLINDHIHTFLSSPKSRKILLAKCSANLKFHEQDFFDFSEQSVLSNFYWGMQNVEAAIQSKPPEDNISSKLLRAEKMLQAPALLNEDGTTAGVSNSYLISYAYFYLSVVRKLQRDELQAAVHFLQALVVSPAAVRVELAPELYRAIVEYCIVPLRTEFRNGAEENEGVKWGARSYKAWLMYHQVISYGQSPLLMKESDEKSQEIRNINACSTSSSNSYEHLHHLHLLRIHQIVHPIDPQKNEKGFDEKAQEKSSVKRLQDLLMEDQSDSPTSICSGSCDFSDDDSEENADRSLPGTSITMSKGPENPNINSFSGILASDLEFWNSVNNEEDEEEEPTWQNFQISRKREAMLTNHKSTTGEITTFCGETSYRIEQAEIVEKVISKLCFSEGLEKPDDSTTVEITTVYEMLASKPGLKYSLLKDVILDQLLMALSTSKEAGVTRASVSILSSIISGNQSVIEDIKKKGLNLIDLANALKRDVHEAAVLIHLINPSPNEIKTLEIMPTLVKIICASSCYKNGLKSVPVTPPSASLMIIQVLVSAFDYSTNNDHLAAISSPNVISSLVNIPRNENIQELISLASILVKCMRFDGKCKYHILQFAPINPFISLILSNHKHAIIAGLEFYHELLRMPRSSSISLLQKLRERGGMNFMCVLLLAIQQTQQEHKLLAASLLLQLDVLEDTVVNNLNREVAIEAFIETLTCEENLEKQQLSAFILSNLGGTYAWTGEPYTIAWLLKKAGLNSMSHKNIVKNINWSDDTLQENGLELWCGKVARHIIKHGDTIFYGLEKGLKSKNKRLSRDCLTTIAWIGCEIVKGHDDLRGLACDLLLSTIEQYLHPGMELEERLLACLCIYNYTFGRGMQRLTQFSEGVRESLRRLSSVTWMAEELLKVADYYMPNKWRISCVHTQVLEGNYNGSGAVNSLIYYRGQLFSGYSNGSIKVWEIKGQTTTLVSDTKEHKKAVTCFALLEQGNCLLSGSADKTIRIWQMVERKMRCIEVITLKEAIQSLETCGDVIFAVTNSHKMKVIDTSRKVKDVIKNKNVKCIRASQGKVYIGCMDSSIHELIIGNNRQQEIKGPSKSWRLQNKPINSISVYKDWLYSASSCIDGSKIKDWRRESKGQVCIVPEKRANVLAMSVVEDFIYLTTSSSPSNLEIWLRGTQHKVGRLSSGSKITSMLTANDMILCGTESGLIKGWIPL